MEDKNLLGLESLLPDKRRRKLIPVWIKIFIWVFMLLSALVPVIILTSGPLAGPWSLYGIETTDAFSIAGIAVCSLFILKGITALGLWNENDWAIKLGIVDATLGIIICSAVTISPIFNPQLVFTFRLELIPLVLYLIWLVKIKEAWEKTT